MKLKLITKSLQGGGGGSSKKSSNNRSPATKITLTSCSDLQQELSSFLVALQQSTTIQEITIRSDFLTDLSEEEEWVDDSTSSTSTSTSSALDQFINVLIHLDTLIELEILSSSRYHIDIMPVSAFRTLPCNLKRLVYEDFQVTAAHDDILLAITDSIKEHSKLEQISLNNFFANDHSNNNNNQPSHYVLDPLLYTLATIPNLQHLIVTGCGSHALLDTQYGHQLVSSKSLQYLLQCRAYTLQTLELSFLEFQDEQIQAIATQLQTQPPSPPNTNDSCDDKSSSSSTCCYALQILHLNYHKMTSIGFQQLMEAMSQSYLKNVYDLSIRNLSEIGSDGYHQAIHMLQSNYTCTFLDVTATPIQQQHIDLFVRLNRYGGRQLLTRTNPNTITMNEWITVLSESNDDIDVTRHLLAELPSLFAYAVWNNPRNNTNNNNNETINKDTTTTTTTTNTTSPTLPKANSHIITPAA